ncbi:hypothetical protein CIB48_g12117 [Xylaria polymorpha]|nr:hypothetical protein CIB48_g12117 [Xylaria polymorpha]
MAQGDFFNDLSWEYGEKEVDVHGFWKLGISKTVHANQVAKSILAGVDETGCYPLFLQPTSGRPSQQAFSSSTASDFLGPESHLRASGNGPNKQLRLIPFMSVMRPGTLTYIKQRLHDPTMPTSLTTAEIATSAAERREQWLTGGPWLPADFLATWSGRRVHDVSLGGVRWPAYGDRLPYDRIVAFEDLQLPESLKQALANAHATLVREKMTQNQFFVAAVWWAHYVVNPDLHRDFGSIVPAAQVPRLMNFAVQVMATLRGTDEYGLAFFPNLARASKTRHDVETSIADSSQAELEEALVNWFTAHPLKVTGHLLPGDLLGTRNAKFPEAEVDMSPVFRAQTSQHRTHADSVRSVVTMLGDVRNIYRQRCHFEDKLRRVTRFTYLISRVEAEDNDTTFLQLFPNNLQIEARRQIQLSNNIDMAYTGMHLNTSEAEIPGRANRPTSEVNAWLEMLSNTGNSTGAAPNTSTSDKPVPDNPVLMQSTGIQTRDDHQALAELSADFSEKREALLAEFNRRVNDLITEAQTIRTAVRNVLSNRSRLSMTARCRLVKQVVRDGGNNLVRGLNNMHQHITTLLGELPEPPDLHVAIPIDTDRPHPSSPQNLSQILREKARACVARVRDGFDTAEENVKSLAATVLPWVGHRNGHRDLVAEDMVNEFSHQSIAQLTGLCDKIIGDILDMSGVSEHPEAPDMPSLDSHDAVMRFARDRLNMIPISEVEAYASNQLGMLSTNEALEFAIESGFEPPADFDHDGN